MADDLSFIRKWIKRGLSKDGKTLDFSNRGINNDIAMDLAENVSLPDIEILYLHTNKIKDLGLEELAQAEIFAPLRELWLYENVIRDEGAVALAESEQLTKLRYLSLYTNRISDEGRWHWRSPTHYPAWRHWIFLSIGLVTGGRAHLRMLGNLKN